MLVAGLTQDNRDFLEYRSINRIASYESHEDILCRQLFKEMLQVCKRVTSKITTMRCF